MLFSLTIFIKKKNILCICSCYHKGLLCKQSLFSLRLTDFGLCATFDPGDDEKSKYQNVRGKFCFAIGDLNFAIYSRV